MSNNIIILTGAVQTGKTTLLQQFCRNKENIAGILTPVVNGRRMFYDICSKVFFEMEALPNEENLAVGKYLFSATAFTKASSILLAQSQKTNIRYLIIDEIGPLEIKKQQGLFEALQKIIACGFNFTLLLVVREKLVEEAVAFLQLNNHVTLSMVQLKTAFKIL